MVRPVIHIYRWLGHGDIRAHLPHPDGPLFAIEDVCDLLELEVATFHDVFMDRTEYFWPAPTIRLDGIQDEFVTLAAARALAENNPSYLTPDFLTWLDERVDEIRTLTVEALVDAATPTPEAARDLTRTWSVRLAAKTLSRDPALNLGQNSLFTAMQGLGWIARVDGIWTPDAGVVKRGLLLQQAERIRGHKELYPRIRITVDGMQELHRRLGGIATLTLEPPTTLTLVEI